MCNDNISNYNSKISGLGILHHRIMGDVGIEHRVVVWVAGGHLTVSRSDIGLSAGNSLSVPQYSAVTFCYTIFDFSL